MLKLCFCINRLYHWTERETEVISSAVRLRNSGYTGGGQTNLFSASRHSYFTFTSSTDFLLCVHVLFFPHLVLQKKWIIATVFFPEGPEG